MGSNRTTGGKGMNLNEILTAWRYGAKISYRHGRYELFLGPYRQIREEVVSELFYRPGIKFKVHK